MKYYIIAEVRENHKNYLDTETIYNDYISEKSIYNLMNSFCELGYDCEFIGGLDALCHLSKINKQFDDIIIINYNYGYPAPFKRGQSPILLEMLNIKYSGSDPLTSLIVNDKSFSKKIVRNIVNTPKSLLVFPHDKNEKIETNQLNYPVIVKPNSEGSSLGISDNSFCRCENEAIKKTNDLLKYYSPVLIEEYIEGFEVTVWIIGNKNNYKLIQPLVISENNNFYFETRVFSAYDKANHVREYSLPERVFSEEFIDILISNSKLIFEELGMRDYGRIDFRVKNNQAFFIEANALPIFSKSSEIGEITKLCKIQYIDICKMMIDAINSRLMSETNKPRNKF